jgi:hypothetical protein
MRSTIGLSEDVIHSKAQGEVELNEVLQWERASD